ncbi:MAG: hypothetical protein H6R00_2445 [Proteobacteria bacterium]|nr:hypothetical protein [Pseudomonadota bacterium]
MIERALVVSFKNIVLRWRGISLLAAVSFGVIVYAGTQIDVVNTINGVIAPYFPGASLWEAGGYLPSIISVVLLCVVQVL